QAQDRAPALLGLAVGPVAYVAVRVVAHATTASAPGRRRPSDLRRRLPRERDPERVAAETAASHRAGATVAAGATRARVVEVAVDGLGLAARTAGTAHAAGLSSAAIAPLAAVASLERDACEAQGRVDARERDAGTARAAAMSPHAAAATRAAGPARGAAGRRGAGAHAVAVAPLRAAATSAALPR